MLVVWRVTRRLADSAQVCVRVCTPVCVHGDVVNFPKHVGEPSEFLFLSTHTQSTWTREKGTAVVMW